MSKKFARFNFVIVSIIVLIGIALSVCSFKLPFFPNDYAGFAGAITMNYDMGEGQSATYKVLPTSEEISTLTSDDMQKTVDFVNMKETEFEIKGRHDPAIIRRACVIVDSVASLCVCDLLCQKYGTDVLEKGIK